MTQITQNRVRITRAADGTDTETLPPIGAPVKLLCAFNGPANTM